MSYEHDITKHGAVGDGRTLSTAGIQAAIEACAKAGGGRVLVPPGTFLAGGIQLKSHVELHLMAGAVIMGSSDLTDYPPIGFTHNEFGDCTSHLWAMNAQNVAITGQGTIHLNDEPFMKWDVIKQGDTFEQAEVDALRPDQVEETSVESGKRTRQSVFFYNVDGLRIEGVTFRRSASWCLCMHSSRNIRIEGISIFNHLRVPNSDGIHFCSCSDAVVANCVLHCGDDCVAITGISDWERETQGIVVTGCTMISRSAAVRIGHLQSKVRGIVLSNLAIRDSHRGIGIFTGDGGYVQDVAVSNCTIQTRLICGHWWGNGEPVMICAADSRGEIRNVQFSNLIMEAENGIVLYGREGNVRDVHFEQISLRLRSGKNRPLLGRWIDLQPAALREAPEATKAIPWLYAREAGTVSFHRVFAGPEYDKGESFSVAADTDGSPIQFI